MTTLYTAIPLVLLLFVGQCRSSNTSQTPMPETPARPEVSPSPVAPGHVRFVGTVVRILDVRSGQQDEPCAMYPCQAIVRVDSVLGYGSGLSVTISSGQEITVHFPFTLMPSEETGVRVNSPLPGLKEGDHFEADAEVKNVLGEKEPRFVVYLYTKRS